MRGTVSWNREPRAHAASALLFALVAAVGCGDDDVSAGPDAGALLDAATSAPTDPTGSQGDAGAGQQPPLTGMDAAVRPTLYAMNNEIYSGDDSTTYVNVLKSLDIASLDTSKAIEFGGGRATIGVVDGRLFVAEPGSPTIARYAVSDSGEFTPDGKLSFANYGSEPIGLDEWGNTFISPTKAYAFYEGTTVVWNPTTLQIVKEIDESTLPTKAGANWSINGSGALVRGNRLFRTLFWSDWEAWQTSPEQYLLVYDTDTDTLLSATAETRCPALGNRIDRDEQGNLYFSNWIWNVPETIRRNAPKSCVLRVPAGSEKFDDWQLTYADLAQGHEGAMFAILGNGKALISVFYPEMASQDPSTTLNELASGDVWRSWTVDLATKTAAPLETLSWHSGAVSLYKLDGRSFVFLPGGGWATTNVHEIIGNGSQPRFTATGWSYQLLKLR